MRSAFRKSIIDDTVEKKAMQAAAAKTVVSDFPSRTLSKSDEISSRESHPRHPTREATATATAMNLEEYYNVNSTSSRKKNA